MIRLTTVANSIDATLLQHQLEMGGIDSFLANENVSTMSPHLNAILGHGVQIMVREEDYQEAKEILVTYQDQSKIIKCPHCGSENIGFGMRGKNRIGDKLLILFTLIVPMPIGNVKNKYYCKDCKESFA